MIPTSWLDAVHHDGSAMYVSNPLPRFGERVTLSLRLAADAPVKAVYIRTMPDGEQHHTMMTLYQMDAVTQVWQGTLEMTMPLVNYRFHIMAEDGLYYYNGLGARRYPMPDLYDFKLLADFQAPSWIDDAVFYQIFPDRFANGDPSNDVRDGEWEYKGNPVRHRPWGERPLHWSEGRSLDFFGGDLAGVAQKLDYLAELGVNAIYLNPIFASRSNHRYNIDDFYTVDKHLGGNDALVSLRQAMDQRDMRLVLDVTPNHSADTHTWFTEAQQDQNAPSASFYTFPDWPTDYVSWLGVSTLPKLNYASQDLRKKMYRDEDSVLRHWLKPPYRIDGWRLDVYNMTARQGAFQANNEVGREMRQAVKAENPDCYFFGEHFFDATMNLQGDELDAAMNYLGFNIPLWRWLAGYDGRHRDAEMADTSLFETESFAQQLDHFRAAVPWAIARMQFQQLGSHDTSRILDIVNGDKRLMKLGVAMLMAAPGVPCIYYGDEVALGGKDDPDNRRCMPWDEADWDLDMLAFYKRIIRLRREQDALRHGGYQGLVARGGLWVFQRQSPAQQIVVVGYRGPTEAMDLVIPVAHGGIANGTSLVDLMSGRSFTVSDGAITLERLAPGDALLLEAQRPT